jgi:hypothetical protein
VIEKKLGTAFAVDSISENDGRFIDIYNEARGH